MSLRKRRWLTDRFRFLTDPRRRGRSLRDACARRVDMEVLETRQLLNGDSVWSFVTAPQIHPPRVSVLKNQPGTAPGLFFGAPYSYARTDATGQAGSEILDGAGNPVWFRPSAAPNVIFDFKAQTFMRRPVLTWWEGSAATGGPGGLPLGTALPGSRFVIYNNHYQLIKTVAAKNGFIADLHDFLITPRGVGVLIGTKVQNADLTPYGGPKDGKFLDAEIQEINLRTGRLMFSWDLGTHVPLSDSYLPAPTSSDIVWDPYHVNSIDVSLDGQQLLLSARHTWTVYDVSQRTGAILWQFGGKHSSLHVDPSLVTGPDNSVFQDQHDARFVPGGISLFDNAGLAFGIDTANHGTSRGMVFSIDPTTSAATLQGSPYVHDPALYSNSQGNMQTLRNGDRIIGWGAEPGSNGATQSYYSEFSSDGTLLYDAVLPDQYVSYRVFRFPWVGQPLTKPTMAITEGDGGQRAIYASWNGSTMTTAWKLLAGPDPAHLERISITPRTGFETAITTIAAGPYYQIQALGVRGTVLKSSAVIRA